MKHKTKTKYATYHMLRDASSGGFVILFAVTLAALLLSIALGVANIALKEIKFGTSARDTNDAFFAADSGIEKALSNDKNPITYVAPGTWNFVVSGLGSGGQSCANVTVDKTVPSVTTIISKGYNIGDSSACSPTNPNRVERELKTTYGGLPPPPPSWYASGGTWAHRQLITIASSNVSGNQPLSSFPVLISATVSAAKADGTDILFTASDGTTKLAHEIEKYSGGQVTAWVNIPSLSNSIDTTFFIYYGNGSAPDMQNVAPTKTAVWNSNYKGVWHLGSNASISGNDSTGVNNGTVSGAVAGVGKIGTGASFSSASTVITIPDNNSLDVASPFTISAWVNSNNSSYGQVFGRNNYGGRLLIVNDYGGWLINQFGQDLITPTPHLSANVWHYVTYTASPAGQSINVDGGNYIYSDAYASATFVDNTSVLIGGSGSYFVNGTVDEVRLSNSARSTDWIKTEYNNQSSPNTFYAIGSQE